MDGFHRILNGIRSLFSLRQRESELGAEIQHHIELETEKNIREGMGPVEARRRALLDFGGVERFKEKTREVRAFHPLEGVARDLRFAARRLIRQPGSSLAIILCLGLGLGAAAGVFPFFFGIVLRPLPFPEAHRLVVLFEASPEFTRANPSFQNYEIWKENQRAFSGLGAFRSTRQTALGPEGPEILEGMRISHEVLGVLGVQPQLGRSFSPDDDLSGAPPTAILGHHLWQTRYGGRDDILGTVVTLDGNPHTIVGVMPRGFSFPKEASYWVPLRTAAHSRIGSVTGVLGRLAEGVEMEGVRGELDRLGALAREARPGANAQREIGIHSLDQDLLWGMKTPATLFLLVALLVTLLATANVANLVLAQGAVRGREMAVRTAMGAPRRRIVRQLLTECLLLAASGGMVALGLGAVGRRLYLSFLPDSFPAFLRLDMELPLLALFAAGTMAVGFLFGLVPALETTRLDLFSGLRSGSAGSVHTRGSQLTRYRKALIALQTGLALAVLLGTGMMARSMWSLKRVPTGLNPDGVLTMEIALSQTLREDDARLRLAWDEIRERVEELPGVRSAAVISHLPIVGAANGSSLFAEGTVAPPPGQEPWVITKQAQPGYFETMGVRILAGRDFGPGDGAPGSPPVVIVNESFARHHWPRGEAVGKRVKWGRPESEFPWMEVVGVAADTRHFGQGSPVELGIYEPVRQAPYWRENLVVRTAGDPMGVVQGVLTEIRAVDGDAPVYNILSMSEVLFRSYWRPAILSRFLWVFTGIALLLAALGVYGVVAFSTAQRRTEFGIRMALGAEKGVILRQALGTSALPAGVGLALGLLVAWAGMRFAASLMFGVSALELPVMGFGLLVMAGVTLLATLLPAKKAAGLDPAHVLKGE